MNWTEYGEAKALLESGEPQAAIERLDALRAVTLGRLATPLLILQAEAWTALDRPRAAADVLLGLVARGEADFWAWYNLAVARRSLGEWPGVFEANREAHALAGWPESRQHGYCFTHDYFSATLVDWQAWFSGPIDAAPMSALEIGSWQGGSACWLLDRVIGPRGGRLTSIDPFGGSSEHAGFLQGALDRLGTTLEALFDANVARTGRSAQLRKLVGRSQDWLPRLAGERFDFIYVDGAHEACAVIQDAVLCWQVLAPGGCMLFDDLTFRFADRPEQDTGRAIEFFVSVFAEEIEVLARTRQLLLRRRAT